MDKKGKVILVDDDSFILGLYAEKAIEKGLDVKTALGGEQFIELAKDTDFVPDAVVIDLMMPDLSGQQSLEKIKQEGLLPNTKFIVLTNVDDEKMIQELSAYNVAAYLVKSTLTPNDMVDKIIEIISK